MHGRNPGKIASFPLRSQATHLWVYGSTQGGGRDHRAGVVRDRANQGPSEEHRMPQQQTVLLDQEEQMTQHFHL